MHLPVVPRSTIPTSIISRESRGSKCFILRTRPSGAGSSLWKPMTSTDQERTKKKPRRARLFYGRYWARTSDPQLVELVLSQLS